MPHQSAFLWLFRLPRSIRTPVKAVQSGQIRSSRGRKTDLVKEDQTYKTLQFPFNCAYVRARIPPVVPTSLQRFWKETFMETPWIRPKHHEIIIDNLGNSVPMYAEFSDLYSPRVAPSRSLISCMKCHYLFFGPSDYCPDCGSRSLRKASRSEEVQYSYTMKTNTFICPSCDGIFERNESTAVCPYCGNHCVSK